MIFEKANYHCLQTCLSNAFPCFASKAPRVKPLARIPPIPPQRRAPCPGFLSGAWGYFFVRLVFFWGRVFTAGTAGEPGTGAGLGEGCSTRGGRSAPAEKPRRGGGGGSLSLRRLCIAMLRKNLIFKRVFLLRIMSMIKSGGRRVRPPLPGEAALRSARSAGMRRDARRAPRGCPDSDRPRLKPLALLFLSRFLIIYNFFFFNFIITAATGLV